MVYLILSKQFLIPKNNENKKNRKNVVPRFFIFLENIKKI